MRSDREKCTAWLKVERARYGPSERCRNPAKKFWRSIVSPNKYRARCLVHQKSDLDVRVWQEVTQAEYVAWRVMKS